MTTIAYKDGVLAADTGVEVNGIYVGKVSKIITNDYGQMGSLAGRMSDLGIFERWMKAGADKDELPQFTSEKAEAFLVNKDGSTEYITSLGFFTIDSPYHAEGSGFELAMGAMEAGATAIQAVEIAIKLDIGSHGPVTQARLKKRNDN